MRTHIIALATTHAILENGTTSGSNTRSVWCACEALVATRSSCSYPNNMHTSDVQVLSSIKCRGRMQESAVTKLQMLDCHSPLLFVEMLLAFRLMQARLQPVCLNQNQIHLVFTTPKPFRPHIQKQTSMYSFLSCTV